MCVETHQQITHVSLRDTCPSCVQRSMLDQSAQSISRVVANPVRGGLTNVELVLTYNITISADFPSSGACTKQPTCDCGKGLLPGVPPGTTRRGDISDDLLPRRERLASDRPSSAHEGVEETEGPEADRKQHLEAGTTREASLALATPQLPFKRWAVDMEAVRYAGYFSRGLGRSAIFLCGTLRRDFS